MINVLDLDYKTLNRNRKVNGERVIQFTVFPTEENIQYFDLIVEEAIVTFKNDEYVIKKLEEKSKGKKYYKGVTAVHKFYVDLINKQQPKIHNGSITFYNYMQMVFEETGYTFEVIDQFSARQFENLGNDNRLALLQKGLDRFKAEFELVDNNKKARIRKMIGNDTDFQFRYGHNIKAINRTIDTTNLATKISGTGDPELGIEASYTSPNVAIFGEIDADPVNDERFKSEPALEAELQERLIDEPVVSITIDFVDLRAAGYPYAIPNEGDRIWLIYEPMDDLLIETRILEINEVFDCNEKLLRTEVTLSNHRKSFAGTMFDNIQKQLDGIVNEDGLIRYSVLDEAVRIATESLQSAQTELEFNNGIIAREKGDPNRLVLLNSKGIGISKDGGNTFTEAITADGFVLTAGAIGRLSANNIQIGPETEFYSGYDPNELDGTLRDDLRITSALPTSISLNNHGITATTSDPNKYARLDHRGLYIKGGAIQIDGGLSDDQIDSADKWNNQGTFIDNTGVYTGIVSANQLVGGILKSQNDNTRFNLNTGQLTMQNADFVLGGGATIRFRAPSNNLTYSHGGRRAGVGFGNSVGGKAIVFMGHTRATDPFTAQDESDFVGFVSNAATSTGAVVNTVAGKEFRVRDNIGDHNIGVGFEFAGTTCMVRPMNNAGYVMLGDQTRPFEYVTANYLSGQVTDSSLRELKKNINPMSLEDSIEFVKNTEIVSFNWKKDEKDLQDKLQVGFIIDDLKMKNPHLVKMYDRNYKLGNVVFMHQQALQHALVRIEELEKEIELLKGA